MGPREIISFPFGLFLSLLSTMSQPVSIMVQDFDLKDMDSCLNILIFSKYEHFKNHITLINEKAIGVFRNLERVRGWFAVINSYLFSFVLLTSLF